MVPAAGTRSKKYAFSCAAGLGVVLLETVLVVCGWFPGIDTTGPQRRTGLAAGVVVSRGWDGHSGGVATKVSFDNAPHRYGHWWIVAAWERGGATTVYTDLNRTDRWRHAVSWQSAATLLTGVSNSDIPQWATVGDEGIDGRSSDAVVALAMVDAATSGDLTGGFDVAASGTLELSVKSATFGAVTHLVEKRNAAVQAGADLLFVPTGTTGIQIDVVAAGAHGRQEDLDTYRTLGSWSTPRLHSGPLLVVAVDSLEEAVAFLCGAGSSAACALFAR